MRVDSILGCWGPFLKVYEERKYGVEVKIGSISSTKLITYKIQWYNHTNERSRARKRNKQVFWVLTIQKNDVFLILCDGFFLFHLEVWTVVIGPPLCFSLCPKQCNSERLVLWVVHDSLEREGGEGRLEDITKKCVGRF